MSFNMHALSEVTSVIHVASREERAAHIGRERLLIYSQASRQELQSPNQSRFGRSESIWR